MSRTVIYGRCSFLATCCLLLSACAPSSQTDGAATTRDDGAAADGAVARQGQPPHPWCKDEPASMLLMTSDSFGPVTVRTTRSELRRACPTVRDTISTDAEGNEIMASVLRFGGVDVGFAEWSGEQLERIRGLSPAVRTARGLGPGSTVRELRATLGALSAGYDDAGVYVWSEAERRLSYLLLLDVTRLLPSPDEVASRPGVVPDSARVRALLFDARG